MEVVANHLAHPVAHAAVTGTPGSSQTTGFEAIYHQAEQALDKIADQFVATALVYPMLEQAGNDPFKSDLFDGGLTESAFRQRLNMHFADEIAASTDFSFSKSMTQQLRQWVRNQSPEALERAGWFKGTDTVG